MCQTVLPWQQIGVWGVPEELSYLGLPLLRPQNGVVPALLPPLDCTRLFCFPRLTEGIR